MELSLRLLAMPLPFHSAQQLYSAVLIQNILGRWWELTKNYSNLLQEAYLSSVKAQSTWKKRAGIPLRGLTFRNLWWLCLAWQDPTLVILLPLMAFLVPKEHPSILEGASFNPSSSTGLCFSYCYIWKKILCIEQKGKGNGLATSSWSCKSFSYEDEIGVKLVLFFWWTEVV